MVFLSDISSDCSDGSSNQGSLQPWALKQRLARLRRCDLASTPSVSGDTGSDTSSGRGSPAPTRWRVVWCHERCHKRESEALRKELGDACRLVGASLVCLKKAGKFQDWLRGGQRSGIRKPTPYVLVSDWREAKPCRDFLSQEHSSNRPLFTVLLCDEGRHFERASTWARGLGSTSDPVHVKQDVNGVKQFLALAAQTTLPTARGERMDRRSSRAPLEQRAHPEFKRGIMQRKPLPNQAAAPPSLHGLAPRGPLPTVTGTMALTNGVQLPQTFAPLKDLLLFCSGTDPLEMERVLKAAMPSHYED